MKVTLEEILPVIEEILEREGEVTFTPNGNSMRPMLISGRDTVTLKKNDGPLKKYDLPLYRNSYGKFILHRVIGRNRAGYIMRGDNLLYKEYGIVDDDIIGKVVRFTHGGKEYAVNNFAYKMYCVLRNNAFTVLLRRIKVKIKMLFKGGKVR